MVVIRNVFQCKPGQAKVLVRMFKDVAASAQPDAGMTNARVMTDLASNFWTVVFETEAESLEAWERQMAKMAESRGSGMDGYMDLVEGGRREIFRIE